MSVNTVTRCSVLKKIFKYTGESTPKKDRTDAEYVMQPLNIPENFIDMRVSILGKGHMPVIFATKLSFNLDS